MSQKEEPIVNTTIFQEVTTSEWTKERVLLNNFYRFASARGGGRLVQRCSDSHLISIFAGLALGDEAKKRCATLPRRPPSLNVNNVNHFRTCNKISLLMMLLGKYTKNYWWRARVIFALQIPFAAATASNPSNFSWCERGTPQLTKGFLPEKGEGLWFHSSYFNDAVWRNERTKEACVRWWIAPRKIDFHWKCETLKMKLILFISHERSMNFLQF